MRRAVCVLLLVMMSVWAFGQAEKKAAGGGGVEQALMDLERKWAGADLKSDAATIGDILASDWIGISSDGKLTSRAQRLDETKKQKMTKSEVSEMKVRMIGADSAVVTGVWTGTGTSGSGEKIDRSERWMDVFAKQGNAWKCVASQTSVMKK